MNHAGYTGDCNKCGACCTANVFIPSVGMVHARCENLVIGEAVGQSEATFCRAHEKIYVGMPIRMLFSNGSGFESRCLSSYPREQDAIPPECSYTWNSKEKQPRWSIGYAPSLGNLISEIY